MIGMDLWAEFRVLDLGERLGRYITNYWNTFFRPDKRNEGNKSSAISSPRGAEQQIYESDRRYYHQHEVLRLSEAAGMRDQRGPGRDG